MNDLSEQQQVQHTWDRPEDASFEGWMSSRVARSSIHRYDWDALKFQADSDLKYRHTQVHYLGMGGMGVAAGTSTVPAEHFAFSTMVIPAGHEGSSYLHTDVEGVFFIIRGKLKLVLEKDGECYETTLTDRDLVSVPPGTYRGGISIGDGDALVYVMLGAKKPIAPTYPPEHPLAKIKR